MMKKVYVVTEGSYSDYHICAIFSSRKLAEIYKRVAHADDIEEYKVNPVDLSDYDGRLYWWVGFSSNGEAREVFQEHASLEEDGQPYKYYINKITVHSKSMLYQDNDTVAYVWAKDKEAAIKVASELRTILFGSHPELVEAARNSRWMKTFSLKNGEIVEVER